MQELLEKGVGILMLTSDYTEAPGNEPPHIVMRRGSICKEYQRGEPTEADILREAIGEVKLGGDKQPTNIGLTGSLEMLINWDPEPTHQLFTCSRAAHQSAGHCRPRFSIFGP